MEDNNSPILGFDGKYRFLSNFYPCKVIYQGREFKSSEAAYQASKCANEEDKNKFTYLSAYLSKKLGRSVKMIDNWDNIKEKVMSDVIISKFLQNDNLKEKLLSTGERYLEETNYWGDKFWGVCNGTGKNKLGKMLMELRTLIRTNTIKKP